MADFKYIMLKRGMFHTPIIFGDKIPHISMVEALTAHPDFKGMKVISAGFYDMDLEKAYGESISMRIAKCKGFKARKNDGRIIRCYTLLHGIE